MSRKPNACITTIEHLRENSTRDPGSNCWLWRWGLSDGMPSFRTINYSTGTKAVLRGPLAVWHVTYQQPANGKFAVRTCPTMTCVCPAHVKLVSTRRETRRIKKALGLNKPDGATPGRMAALAKAWGNKLLPEALVKQIYLHPGKTYAATARELGVHPSVVGLIKSGRRRRDVTAALDPGRGCLTLATSWARPGTIMAPADQETV